MLGRIVVSLSELLFVAQQVRLARYSSVFFFNRGVLPASSPERFSGVVGVFVKSLRI